MATSCLKRIRYTDVHHFSTSFISMNKCVSWSFPQLRLVIISVWVMTMILNSHIIIIWGIPFASHYFMSSSFLIQIQPPLLLVPTSFRNFLTKVCKTKRWTLWVFLLGLFIFLREEAPSISPAGWKLRCSLLGVAACFQTSTLISVQRFYLVSRIWSQEEKDASLARRSGFKDLGSLLPVNEWLSLWDSYFCPLPSPTARRTWCFQFLRLLRVLLCKPVWVSGFPSPTLGILIFSC